jgi:hypothetical protein
MTTDAPSSANLTAVAFPIPAAPPLIRATLSSRRIKKPPFNILTLKRVQTPDRLSVNSSAVDAKISCSNQINKFNRLVGTAFQPRFNRWTGKPLIAARKPLPQLKIAFLTQ